MKTFKIKYNIIFEIWNFEKFYNKSDNLIHEAEAISMKRDSEPEEANYYLLAPVAVAVAAVDYAGFVSN